MTIVDGVGLLLIGPDDRIFLLRELRGKAHFGKAAGMVSFPIETIEPNETSFQALGRLIKEEIGVSMLNLPMFFKKFMINLNGIYTEQLFMYQLRCPENFVATPDDDDVEHFGWLLPNQILELGAGRIRLEVRPVIGAYLES